jgi:hypothetical protein
VWGGSNPQSLFDREHKLCQATTVYDELLLQ